MTLRRLLRGAAWTALSLAVVLVAALVVLLVRANQKLSARYPIAPEALALSMEGASLERGEHLVRAVGTCTLCHGADLGGAVYADAGPIGIMTGPNLTRGRGGIGASLTIADWVRAIRYGVRADGTSLFVMPSEVFTKFSDQDLRSIIAYGQQVPPVDREVPASKFRLLGRVLLGAGRLNLLVAPKTHHDPSTRAGVPERSGASYGRYLADVSGCHGCHGHGLSGGRVAGPPGLPPASNLTPAGLEGWSSEDFICALREGERPDGRAIDDFMPWKTYRTMTDDELLALWAYLQNVPPRPFGNK